jgi:predicted nucleic acid-binding protein
MLVGVVYAELMRGARNPEQLEILQDTLQALPYTETDRDTWTLTGNILYSLDRTGERIPVTDALIAAIAIQNDLPVYTQDAHFNRVSDLRRFEPSST